jgi:imidazolonepropionase-like amidohydrolase
VIRGGMLIDGVGETPVRNAGIVIRGGTLLEVNVDVTGRDLSRATVIDVPDDHYIIPGMIDLHAHFEVDFFGGGRLDEVHINPIVFLANGITTVFPAGESDSEAMRSARLRINTGKAIGPRILNSGPRIGTERQGVDPRTVEEMHHVVDSLVARGVAGFKAKEISPPMLRALIQRAHMHGLTVTGHLESGHRNTTNAKDAILMGIDRVEHVLGGDGFPADRSVYETLPTFDPTSEEGRAIIELYIRHDVVFVPTQSANGYRTEAERSALTYDETRLYTPFIQELTRQNPRTPGEAGHARRAGRIRSTTAFYQAGGTMAVGTDAPARAAYHPGIVYHSELASFVEAGVPPAEVLRMATINGARALNQGEKLGSIEPNKFADLVVVRGNPLQDIRNTRNVEYVVKAGVPYRAADLLRSVEGKLGPTGPDDAARWGAQRRVQ